MLNHFSLGIGAFLTIIATFMQTFAPKGNMGMFIGGRVIIGIGQGIALSKSPTSICTKSDRADRS